MHHLRAQLNYQFWFVLVAMCLRSTVAITRELTTHIEAGEISCFYEGVKANQVIDVEYQVIDGGHGDLDISFALYSPNNIEMVQEYKKPDNIHRLTAHTSGDHKFCYDNSFSRFNRKTVFFEIIIESEDDTQDPWNKDMLKDLTPDETLHEKVEGMQEILIHIHSNLNKIKHDLDVRRSTEARDRNVAEGNNFKVSIWSFVQICLMIVVGGIQVYMLRSLFETDARSNVWKKIKILN